MRYILRFAKPLFLVAMFMLPCQATGAPASCSYETYSWNIHLKKAVAFSRISHPYRQLTKEEVDPVTGCTVCLEDQVQLSVPPLPPFRVCRKLAPDLRRAIEQLVHNREPIYQVVGYRVGKTRGDADANGNRTRFSNHAYGTALDINPQQNGLYGNCIAFGPQCRLIKGGPWRPGENPASILPDGDVVYIMRSIGFKWGGEIKGRQKDFMHFSISGY